MLMIKSPKTSQQRFAAGFFLVCCIALGGCSSLSDSETRLAKLVAPNQLARSSGGIYATTDSYLAALGFPNASEQVQLAVSLVPQDAAILFVASDSSPETELAYRSIAYLSWPRQIGALHCGVNGKAPTLLFQPREDQPIRWMMFYRRPVPAGLAASTEVKELGLHLKLVRVQEGKEWTFYCSQ